MINLNALKQHMIEQLTEDFDNHLISPFPHNWREGVEILFNFAQTSVGFSTNLFQALQAVLIDKPTDYNSLVSFINYMEKYLGLIAKTTGLAANATSLIHFMKELILSGENFSNCRSRKDITTFSGQKPLLENLCAAYCTRNEVNHAQEKKEMPTWYKNQAVILKNRNGALTVLLLATLKHRKALLEAIERYHLQQEPEFKPYLDKVNRQFEKWQKRFVALHGREQIELYAREELEDEDQQARKGSIAKLRAELLEKQFMLLGDAGMGKSTTLQYLAWEDAQACLRDSLKANLPVYVELKLLSNGRKLLDTIFSILGFDYEFSEQLLQKRRLSLFLDGLNEVPKQDRERVSHEIQGILNAYPKLPIIIAGRAPYRFMSGEQCRLPVFSLQRMNDQQLEEFLEKNSRENVKQLIRSELAEEDNLRDWLRVPMLFMMLLEVADDICKRYPDDSINKFQEHTENKIKVIQTFVHKIYRRESERDQRFGEVAFDTLLSDLAAKIFTLYTSNASLQRNEVIKTLSPRLAAGFPDLDLDYFLSTSVHLGILSKDENQYSFAHEEYFDYYAEQGLN